MTDPIAVVSACSGAACAASPKIEPHDFVRADIGFASRWFERVAGPQRVTLEAGATLRLAPGLPEGEGEESGGCRLDLRRRPAERGDRARPSGEAGFQIDPASIRTAIRRPLRALPVVSAMFDGRMRARSLGGQGVIRDESGGDGFDAIRNAFRGAHSGAEAARSAKSRFAEPAAAMFGVARRWVEIPNGDLLHCERTAFLGADPPVGARPASRPTACRSPDRCADAWLRAST